MVHVQAEPSGHLRLDEECTKALSLEMSASQRQLMSAMVFTTPVSPCLAALTCLQISIIDSGTDTVEYFSTTIPSKRMRNVSKGFTAYASPVFKYTQRPVALNLTSFKDYYRKYVVLPGKKVNKALVLVGKDDMGCNVYQRDPNVDALVRFTEYHPIRASEGYWFNFLLDVVPFRHEDDLLSHTKDGSYLSEVLGRNILHVGSLQEHLTKAADAYCTYHMLSSDERVDLIDQLVGQCGTALSAWGLTLGGASDGVEGPDSINLLTPAAEARLRKVQLEFEGLDVHTLTAPQAGMYNAVAEGRKGLFILTGPGGSGKTYLLRNIINFFRKANRPLLVSASTGAAAARVTRTALTNHSAYCLPVSGPIYNLSIAKAEHAAILAADCFILDECSMMTNNMLTLILCRIKGVRRLDSIQQLLQEVTIILSGDMYQVRSMMGVCSV